MPEERIELLDPEREGTSERLFFEESFRLGRRSASGVRIVVARAVYKDRETQEITTVDKPKEIFERGLLAPSMIAHLLVSKYRFGIPKYWRATRARLRPDELAREIGPLTVPPRETSAAE